MAADWEQLANEITDPNIVIAEVDCTAEESEETCNVNDVKGFPSLKYGDPSFLEEHVEARDFQSLFKFANTNLKAGCTPKTLDLCDTEQKTMIEKFMTFSLDELIDEIDEIEENMDDLDEAFDESQGDLEAEYESIMGISDAAKKVAKDAADYKTIKSVLAVKMMQGGSDEL